MNALDAPPSLPAMPARFPGQCRICGHRILAHVDLIVKLDGAWSHADCAETEGHDVVGNDPEDTYA